MKLVSESKDLVSISHLHFGIFHQLYFAFEFHALM